MKLNQLLVLPLCAALLCSFAACKLGGASSTSLEPSSSTPEVIVDPNWPATVGNVTLAQKPEQVVTLSPAMTELVCELGARNRLAGVSDSCDFPADITELPALGSTAQPDLEGIQETGAQLVFSSAPLTQEDTVWLQQQNIAVIVFPRVDSVDALEERYRGAGVLLDGLVDGDENGGEVFSALKEKYDALTAATTQVETRYEGLWLRAVPLMAATGDTWEGKLLEEALAVDNSAKEYVGWEYPADKAVDLYPDMIFYDQSIDPEYFKGTQVYNTTDAYKKERMFAFDAVVFERQSGRMFDELIRMFTVIYPDIPVGSPPAPTAPDEALSEGESSPSGALEEPTDG